MIDFVFVNIYINATQANKICIRIQNGVYSECATNEMFCSEFIEINFMFSLGSGGSDYVIKKTIS